MTTKPDAMPDAPANPALSLTVVVNANPDQQAVLVDLLKTISEEVRAFDRAVDALAYMQESPPALVVTDVEMNGMDGWALCRCMRSAEHQVLNEVPILVVSTTFAGCAPQKMAIGMGADAFLSAPVGLEELSQAVAELLGRKDRPHLPLVLIVTPDQPLADRLQATLDANGYRTTKAMDSHEARAVLAAQRGDLAVIDHRLPDGSGEALLEWVRAEHRECICFMMDEEPTGEAALNGLKKGAAFYLQKPVPANLLLELFARARREQAVHHSVEILQARAQEGWESTQNYKQLFNAMQEGFAVHEIMCDDKGRPIDYRFLDVNPGFERLTGLKARDVVGRTVLEVLPDTEQHWIETFGQVALTGEPALFENYSNALGKYFLVTAFQTKPNQFACMFQDVTAHRFAEREQRKLQDQLQQTQKLDSIGRLAGGVAHDFNNMLGVILGHAEMAMDVLDPAHEAHADLQEIRKAAERSANLTRQLLAFARKQTVTPQVLQLNAAVADIYKMLKRLIGESIELEWQPGETIWSVKVDPSQIDQILANLCVNARDAITGHGRVTISTENCVISASDCVDKADATPGEYVCLKVTDSGTGMDQVTQENIFEPFFTTKAPGMGTGLGLSTVYGIIRQNKGFITVQSKVSEGTEFSVYLPRFAQTSTPVATPTQGATSMRGQETILVVEDEQAILDLIGSMLDRLGYQVLKAATPGEAIEMAEQHPVAIDLLLTDVIMPEMNGRSLAKNIQTRHPDIQCVFMSGYTADVIVRHGVLNTGVHFLQKPVSLKVLANKIREVLGEKLGT